MTAKPTLHHFTAEIVSSYASKNATQPENLADLMHSIYTSLAEPEQEPTKIAPIKEKLSSIRIKTSIKPEGLVSFIDVRLIKV